MDELLDRCLLQALSVSVKPSHVPLPASSLWSNHVLPCRSPGTTVDIKKSSHKKLSKWMHAKAVDGLISSKEDKHRREFIISSIKPAFHAPTHHFRCTFSDALIAHATLLPLPFQISGKEDKHCREFILSSINHRHQALLAFSPYKTAQSPTTAPKGSFGVATGSATVTTTTTVEEVFKPSLHVSPVFESVGLDPHAFYSPSAVHSAAICYISLHSLLEPSDPSIVVLDATLYDALYKGAIKKGATYPAQCPKRDIGPMLLQRMQAQHRVERAGRSVERKGELEPVEIFVRGRQGSRRVTRVTGVETYLVEAEPLAAELQKKFASGASVAPVPGGFTCNGRQVGSPATVLEAELHGASHVSKAELHGANQVSKAELHSASDVSKAELHGASHVSKAEQHGASHVSKAELHGASHVIRAELQKC
ncbi:unnamed protein product [Closterium sp. Naga37s-1]|nr:unnamed protein product [Closterium sp. Naga37s-1]